MATINPDLTQPTCRICLQNEDEENMSSIFNLDTDINHLYIYEKIEQCAGIKILRHEKMPTLICNNCYGFLKVSYKFRIICRNANEYLKEFLVKDEISSQTVEVSSIENPLAENVNNEKVNKRIPYKRKLKIVEDTAIDAQTFIIEKDVERLNATVNIEPETIKDDEFEAILEDEVDEDIWFDNDDDNDENFEISTDDLDSDIKEDDEASEDMEKFKGSEHKRKITKTSNKIPTNILSVSSDEKKVIRERKPRAKRKKSEKHPHICDICGNIYQRRYGLEAHMKRHGNEKPFGCEICPQAFYSNFELKRHMRKHTGLKPYQCSYCPRAFGDQSTLIKHERVHRNERPFKCDTCGKSFAYTGVLNCHKLTHTGEKPFRCELCGKCFGFAYHLRAHLLTQQHSSDPRSKILLQNIKRNNDGEAMKIQSLTL